MQALSHYATIVHPFNLAVNAVPQVVFSELIGGNIYPVRPYSIQFRKERITMKMSLRNVLSIALFYIIGVCIVPGCNRVDKPETGHADAAKPPSGKHDNAAAQEKGPVESITSYDHLTSIIDNSPGKLLVFDMFADWCKPCRMLAPTYEALAETHKENARFFRVDVQQHQDIASAFRVNGIPNVVFIKDKEVVQAITGLNPREYYERIITACGPSVSAAECKAKLAEGL